MDLSQTHFVYFRPFHIISHLKLKFLVETKTREIEKQGETSHKIFIIKNRMLYGMHR